MRLSPLRLIEPWAKLLGLLVWNVVGFLGYLAFSGSAWPGLVPRLVGVGTLLLVARAFRTRGEDVIAPRPWWRLTGGWISSSVAFLIFGSLAGFLIGAVALAIGSGEMLAARIADAAIYMFLAAAYLNSAIRLYRLPSAAVPRVLR